MADRLLELVWRKYVLYDIEMPSSREQQVPLVKWLRAPNVVFRDDFFGTTTKRILQESLKDTVVTTGVDVLLKRSQLYSSRDPSGFIFHISRCGSTTLSNMLMCAKEHFVLSEPHLPVKLFMQFPDAYPISFWIDIIRASMRTLGASAPKTASRYFVKLFHSYVLEVPIFRQALPKTPEIFLYRDPLEVLMSHAKAASSWWYTQATTGLSAEEIFQRPIMELAARGIGRMLQAMVDHSNEETLLINYSEFGPSIPRTLLEFFGIPVTEQLVDDMLASAAIYSKGSQRTREFIPDSEAKRQAATPMMRNLIMQFADRPYQCLERLRRRRIMIGTKPALHTSVGLGNLDRLPNV